MLTPKEIQEITFKSGRGYKKEDVDAFLRGMYHDYEIMYRNNQELKDKISTLSDGIQYYKNLEKTLQKSLILAEKTSEETKEAAQKQAAIIERQAKLNADRILTDARNELVEIERRINELKQNFELYKTQFRQITKAQLELLESDHFSIVLKEHNIELYSEKEKKEEKEDFKEPDFTETLEENLESIHSETEEKEAEKKLAQAVTMEEKPAAVKEEAVTKPEKESKELAEDEAAPVKEILESVKKNMEAMKADVSSMQEDVKSAQDEMSAPAEEALKEEVSSDTSDLEIKMLQKLLNDIKKKNVTDSGKDEFEFISTDTEE